MPQTEIFFEIQSPCMINGQPQNVILSTKVSPYLPLKRPNGKPFFRAMFMPQTEIFFEIQYPCRINGQTQN
jgi:hypothetical protein